MPRLVRYRWRYLDPLCEISLATRHWATAHDMRIAHPDAAPLEGTRQELALPDDPFINSTGILCASQQ